MGGLKLLCRQDSLWFEKMTNDGYFVNEVNRKLLDSINDCGKAYMTHCEVDGAFVIRCAICSTLT